MVKASNFEADLNGERNEKITVIDSNLMIL